MRRKVHVPAVATALAALAAALVPQPLSARPAGDTIKQTFLGPWGPTVLCPVYSPDGLHAAYVTTSNSLYYAVLDGRIGARTTRSKPIR